MASSTIWISSTSLLLVTRADQNKFQDFASFIAYAKDSWYEVKKVVWPTRKETTQMTLVVFGFVVIMSLFLWIADKLIEWLVFSVFLGWK